MKLSECIIVWTPDWPEYAPGFRGKVRIFPAHSRREQLAPFARWAGQPHEQTHDPRLAVRHVYLLQVITRMRYEGLKLLTVHDALSPIDEYQSLLCDEFALRRARRAA